MRSAAVLALLLCAGQVSALPVNSPMNKGDTKVMKCIVEVISDSLSKPSPMPVSHDCLETLQRDERILSILRHQNLLKELQDLALQGAKERARQQPQPSSFGDELSEVLENRSTQAKPEEVTGEPPAKDAVEKREGSEEAESGGVSEGGRPRAFPEPRQGPPAVGNSQAPGGEEATPTQPPASVPGPKYPGLQAAGHREGPPQGLVDRAQGLSTEHGQQARRPGQEEEEEEAGEKAGTEDEGPTAASDSHPGLGDKELWTGQSEAPAVDGAWKPGAAEVQPPKGQGERVPSRQEEEEVAAAEAPRGGPQPRQSGELARRDERPSREWEDARRWSKMDQLAQELTAEKRLDGDGDEDDDPDGSMKLSFRARAYGFRGPGLQLPRGWRPASREDSVEADLPLQARGDPEEKKEEEGSANRRAEDQELESLSAIEAELEKVARQLQALRRG